MAQLKTLPLSLTCWSYCSSPVIKPKTNDTKLDIYGIAWNFDSIRFTDGDECPNDIDNDEECPNDIYRILSTCPHHDPYQPSTLNMNIVNTDSHTGQRSSVTTPTRARSAVERVLIYPYSSWRTLALRLRLWTKHKNLQQSRQIYRRYIGYIIYIRSISLSSREQQAQLNGSNSVRVVVSSCSVLIPGPVLSLWLYQVSAHCRIACRAAGAITIY